MHIATRTVAVLAATVALTATALPASQADEPTVTVRDRLGQIAQVDEAVPISKSPTESVRDGRVTLGTSASSTIAVDLPVTRTKTKKSDGRYVLPGRDDASVTVAPTATGTQILVGIESAEAPTTYRFGLGSTPGVRPELTPDGGVDLIDRNGILTAQVEAPWAVDAEGRRVPTRYEVRSGAITQVVDHRAGSFTYPIVADPKFFPCDKYTSLCVKFNKKETKSIANKAKKVGISTSLAVFICAKIPHPLIAIGCAATVLSALPSLRKTFVSAAKKGQCAELHFRVPSGLLWKWKKEKC